MCYRKSDKVPRTNTANSFMSVTYSYVVLSEISRTGTKPGYWVGLYCESKGIKHVTR